MPRYTPGLLTAVALVGVVGCTFDDSREAEPLRGEASRADADAAVAAQLDSIYGVFTRAYAEADVDLLMDSIYAPNAYYLPPSAPILEGGESFRDQFAGFLDPIAERGGPGPDISFDIRDRGIEGALAYDIGVYTIRPPSAPAGAEGSRGKFIVIWKRNAAGHWRIHADGFSGLGG